MKYISSEFAITNKRFLGRIFGYGTIVVAGTGGITESFNKISQPLEFRNKLYEQVALADKSK